MDKIALQDEKEALDARIAELRSSDPSGVDEMEQSRRGRQISAMVEYSDILADRIANSH